VKFLVDNQLPAALAVYLRKKGMDSEHVLDAGLGEATDAELCRYATANERIIVTKDEDFLYLASEPKATFQLLGFGSAIAAPLPCLKRSNGSGRSWKHR
jgi:predicted nuclease of predicted toxin-antitoxin system